MMNHEIINRQKYFILVVLFSLIILTIILMFVDKGDVIIGMNDFRSPIGNIVANYITMIAEGGVFVLIIIFLLFYNYASSLSMLILSLSVLISSYLLKLFFAHPRPYLYFYRIGKFDKVIGYDKDNLLWSHSSFPSGHTLAAFSIAIFLSFIFPKYRYLLVVSATIVALTRIYLVHHFLEDIIFGAFCGLILGMSGVWLYNWIFQKYPRMHNSLNIKSLISKK